ncbi:hypothetical protein FRB98_003861 [Tulasnella sp. 332]|nr:hypothetical protein FRB98_003861 [Tulasnella sp. 332]
MSEEVPKDIAGPFVLIVIITAKPGKADEVAKHLSKVRAHAESDKEPDCLTCVQMRSSILFSIAAVAGQAAAVIITQTLYGGLCESYVNGPTMTVTYPGATTITPAPTATRTEIATVLIVTGFTTITEQPNPAFATPAPQLAARDLTTVIETYQCTATSTQTLPTVTTITDPHVTSTVTSYGHTTVVTTTIVEWLR